MLEGVYMEKYFRYLDRLRDSGKINMLGAAPYLQREFPELGFDQGKAQDILRTWMDGFSESSGETPQP